MTSESWSVFCSKVEGFEVEMNSDWKVIGNIFEGHGYDRRVEAGMEWIGSDGKGGGGRRTGKSDVGADITALYFTLTSQCNSASQFRAKVQFKSTATVYCSSLIFTNVPRISLW